MTIHCSWGPGLSSHLFVSCHNHWVDHLPSFVLCPKRKANLAFLSRIER